MKSLSHKILYMQHKNTEKAQIILDTLAEIIREERIAKNKSQRLLADEYDIQKSLLSRIENGNNEPKIISVFTICEALDIKVSTLFQKLEARLPENFSLID